MSRGQTLRALVNERLTAAAEEIFLLFERTIALYEEELCRSKEENQRKRQLLGNVQSLRIEEVRGNFQVPSSPDPGLKQEMTESPQIKEDPEEHIIKQEREPLPVPLPEFSAVGEKTGEFSLFQQRQTEHREDISSEPHLSSESEGHTEHSSDTDNDYDGEPLSWSAAEMETEADGDHYNHVQTRNGNTKLSPQNKSAPETTVHSEHMSGSHRGAVKKKLRCSICNKSFERKGDLERHIRVHTGVYGLTEDQDKAMERRARLCPEAEAALFISSESDKLCLRAQWINDYKGRGVFACVPIEKGSFVVEYRGELISQHERDKRQTRYTEKQNVFLFEFAWNNSTWCIDASREDGSLGRLVNDDHISPNCKVKKLTVEGKPHLCLFAMKNIQADSEITYDYGQSQLPWRTVAQNVQVPTQPPASPEDSETFSSLVQQNRASRRLHILKRNRVQCEGRYAEAKLMRNGKERRTTLRSITTQNVQASIQPPPESEQSNTLVEHPSADDHGFHGDSLSLDAQNFEFSDNAENDFAQDSCGSSSDMSVCSREQGAANKLGVKEEFMDVSLGTTTEQSEESTALEASSQLTSSSSPVPSVLSVTVSSSGNISYNCSVIKVAPVQIKEKQLKNNKKQYCLYCKKGYSKLARHLQAVHNTESDVAKAFSFSKRSRERRDLLCFLKKKGNFDHNAVIATQGAGEMVACRRPSTTKQVEEYRHCKFCKGLYAKYTLWRHMKICSQKSAEGQPFKGRQCYQMYLPKPERVHEGVWKIACEMNPDAISFVVRSERDILSLGESLFNAKKLLQKRKYYIQQKLRAMARLLIMARAITPLKSTEDLVMPNNFPYLVQAVRAVSGKTPSSVLTLRNSLAKIAGIVQHNAIIANRSIIAESAKQFVTLCAKKWAKIFSSAALSTFQQDNKPQVLPFTEDVSLLHRFLATEGSKCMKDLEENPQSITFSNLAKVTLTQIVLFNRKKAGKVSKMELQAFTSRDRSQLNLDVMMSLTELERKLAEHFDRVEIRSKSSRMVPVFLTPGMIAAMDLLVKNRNACKVSTDNVFLFACPGVLSHYRASDCLRMFANQCGTKYPEALTSARFRKQVAILSTILNLDDLKLDTFLGHDIHVHCDFDRLSESVLQLAKVSKLLMAMEKGSVCDFQGKGLDDIEIKPEEEVPTSDDEDDDDDFREETVPDSHQHKVSPKKALMVGSSSKLSKEKQVMKRRSRWHEDEVKAVERHMLHFVLNCQVPGKKDCESCLRAEPEALMNRDWTAIKYYIHNRITVFKKSHMAK